MLFARLFESCPGGLPVAIFGPSIATIPYLVRLKFLSLHPTSESLAKIIDPASAEDSQ